MKLIKYRVAVTTKTLQNSPKLNQQCHIPTLVVLGVLPLTIFWSNYLLYKYPSPEKPSVATAVEKPTVDTFSVDTFSVENILSRKQLR